MRVLLVTTMYPVPGNPAFGAFVAEQVQSLRALGLTVNIEFLNTRRSRLIYAVGAVRIARALSQETYDLIHTHHTYSFVLTDIARIATRKNVPIVLTNHEGEALNGMRFPKGLHPTAALRQSVPLKRLIASRADFVIFVSRMLSERIVSSSRFEVIPCGVDLDKFRPLDKAFCRSQLALPPTVPVVFFPARPEGRGKRFELAQRAFQILRGRVPQAILVTGGRIPHDKMPLYYNAADIVLQASHYEASPTVVKEALACEVPIVSTNSGDTREVVGDTPHCAVCADDPHELASAIRSNLGHRATAARAHLRGKGLALDQVARRVMGVYERVLGTEGSRDASSWRS